MSDKPSQRFTAEERAAMKERSQEVRRSSRRGASAADGESEVLAKIAEMPEPDRAIGERLHALIKETAPDLTSKTWYGMPAYAKGKDTICFFQPASKFKARFATLGFSDKAKLDDGDLWPVYYAVQKLTPAVEKRIAELVKEAAT